MNKGAVARAKNKGSTLPTSLRNGDLVDVSDATLEVTNGTATPSSPSDSGPPRQRPYAVVAVEEDDEDIIPGPPTPSSPKPTSFSKIFGNSSGKSTTMSPSKHTVTIREQARPPDRSTSLSARSAQELDISLTEHNVKGNGILASRADLSVAPEEFAAGCKIGYCRGARTILAIYFGSPLFSFHR